MSRTDQPALIVGRDHSSPRRSLTRSVVARTSAAKTSAARPRSGRVTTRTVVRSLTVSRRRTARGSVALICIAKQRRLRPWERFAGIVGGARAARAPAYGLLGVGGDLLRLGYALRGHGDLGVPGVTVAPDITVTPRVTLGPRLVGFRPERLRTGRLPGGRLPAARSLRRSCRCRFPTAVPASCRLPTSCRVWPLPVIGMPVLGAALRPSARRPRHRALGVLPDRHHAVFAGVGTAGGGRHHGRRGQLGHALRLALHPGPHVDRVPLGGLGRLACLLEPG